MLTAVFIIPFRVVNKYLCILLTKPNVNSGWLVSRTTKINALVTITTSKEITVSNEKHKIISQRPSSPSASHFEVRKTTQLIWEDFIWNGLKQDVQNFIKACDVCQRFKSLG